MSPDTISARAQIVASLGDKEYRDILVQESINQGIAFQIRANRNRRGWTQGDLGREADKAQSEISRFEDPDYEGYTLKTLTRLASAFDVALAVRFVPFSALVDDMTNPSGRSFDVPGFNEDEGLTGPTLAQSDFFALVNTTNYDTPSNVVHIHTRRQPHMTIADPYTALTPQEEGYQWQTTTTARSVR